MKKKLLVTLMTTATIAGLGLFAGQQEAHAHGYVDSPAARGYQGKLDINHLGWSGAFNMYGNVITNPQSLEAPKGFPAGGPVDGRIASANGGSGQINDFVLDEQASNRWVQQKISTGSNVFSWHFTAPHSTAKWHYYMTQPGWDQNAPLSRDSLELIGTVGHDGSPASNNPAHTINVPENRMGYHVILAVWDIGDTSNAFYNVIDVDVNNNGIPLPPPGQPTGLRAQEVTQTSASLAWDTQANAQAYNVYRDGERIQTVTSANFNDTGLSPDTEYKYEVEAVGQNGTVSAKSDALSITTEKEEAGVPTQPTAPSNLHSMGTTTNSVRLMWTAPQHSDGVKEYQIFRDGKQVGTSTTTSMTDEGLTSNTAYSYTVRAVSNNGLVSVDSNTLNVRTASEGVSEERTWKVGTHTKPELYTAGERVTHNGVTYITRQTHNNFGDSNWAPDKAASLFQVAK